MTARVSLTFGTYDLIPDGDSMCLSTPTTENVSADLQECDTDSSKVIHITKGYSRDHRPDLNQVILQLCPESSRDSSAHEANGW